MMKKVLALIFALTFSFTVISSANAVYAADTNGGNDNNNDIAADTATDDDDDMEWGWIGLLGLAGLMGLKRRDDRKD